MKKLLILLLALILVMSLAACGDSDKGEEENENGASAKLDITGVSFSNAEFVYDGLEHSITVSGTLPAGVTVSYTGATGTNAGTYNATAVLTGDGYNPLTLNATLTIAKADITGISATAEQEVYETLELQKPSYSGTVPAGVSVKYVFDGVERAGIDQIGTYQVSIVFYGDNYNTLTLPVTFKIKFDYTTFVERFINSFNAVPDLWGYLPESFDAENRLVESIPDYSTFCNISSIPTNGMGKQLNMLYSVMTKADTAVDYVNYVYGALNGIKALYSAYLDGNPDDYKNFSGTISSLNFNIAITDNQYTISATVSGVEIQIFSNIADVEYGAYIKISQNNVIKYTVSEDNLTVAMDILDSASLLVDFSKDEDGNSVGTIYEYVTVSGVEAVSASAMLYVGEEYSIVIGTKGDFMPGSTDGRNCEIYDNDTGRFVGAEVREVLESKQFDTYWFALDKIEGINSIKKEDVRNWLNADTIYINGCDDSIHVDSDGIINPTRHFDIEFKKMYFYQLTVDGEYEQVEIEIPMMFIQAENYDDFNEEFSDKNADALNNGTVTLEVSGNDLGAINYGYETLLPLFDQVKDLVTHEYIINYCKAEN